MVLNSKLPGSSKFPATCYIEGTGHPSIKVDADCKGCYLSQGTAVGPSAPDDISFVKLIVISDYPGAYETEFNWCQVPNISVAMHTRKHKRRILPFRNSGQFLRDTIEEVFGICSWGEVYYTNAVKCDPNARADTKVVAGKQLKACGNLWLLNELEVLDRANPNTPILLAGSKAIDAFGMLFPELKRESISWGIKGLRKIRDIKWKSHPLCFTFNPAMPARNEMRLETQMKSDIKSKILTVKEVSWWEPVLLGSPTWHFLEDIKWLSSYVVNDGELAR